MTFEDWMIHKGLSTSSVKKYIGAIQGSISDWAFDNGLIEGPLTSFTSYSLFKEVKSKIQNLPIYQARNERGHNMYSSALDKFSEYLSDGYENDVEFDVERILSTSNVNETERISLLKARIGQGSFRQKLIKHWNGCAVTGFKDLSFLTASHIKPWNASNNSERLDSFNGLLLLPNLDKAFDSGYISFDESGLIIISPLFKNVEKLGINELMKIKLCHEHQVYLSFHRNNVFRNG